MISALRAIGLALFLAGLLGLSEARAEPGWLAGQCQTMGRAYTPVRGMDSSGEMLAGIGRGAWRDVRWFVLAGYAPSGPLTRQQQRRLDWERRAVAITPAAARGDMPMLRRLLRAGVSANLQVSGDEYFSPLVWAARCGHPAAVRLLLAHGADINSTYIFVAGEFGYRGFTPLMFAADAEERTTVAELLRHNPDLDARYEVSNLAETRRWPGTTALQLTNSADIRRMLRAAAADRPVRGRR